jgi:serine/threonine protein kinase
MRISEIPHVDHGRTAVCSCHAAFTIDDSTVMEEFSLPDLPPPESIGRYSIVRYLGRGAMNCVYEGVHPELGIPVAVKTLLPEYAADRPSREQFLHAAKIDAKVDHPNIVKVYETGRDGNGVPFLAMEFLSGGSLADRMLNTPCFPAKETAKIGAEVCRALVETAAHGIVHRDIKPDNIMLSAEGKYKLTDLGLAKLDSATVSGTGVCILDENDPAKAVRKTSFGTLEYMSPEQCIDTESCDIRSDIYSLGVTMYQLAAGRLPFETQTRSELRHMHISVEPLVPSAYVHDIPIDFDYIVMHCIQKRPEDRYSAPEELLADLEAFLADAPLPSTTSGAVPLNTGTARSDAKDACKRQPGHSFPRPFFRSLFYSPATIVLLTLAIVVLTGAYMQRLKETRSAKKRQEMLPSPPEQEHGMESVSVFSDESSVEPGIPHVHPSTKTLDAEITIGGVSLDAQTSGLFEETRRDAEQAMKNGFGFKKAIEDLDTFSSSEEYQKDALNLISELKKASGEAVAELMETLNEKADRLVEEGNYDAAINVYSTDIGPLAPESRIERERKIRDLEKMRQDAASGFGSGESGTGEAFRP